MIGENSLDSEWRKSGKNGENSRKNGKSGENGEIYRDFGENYTYDTRSCTCGGFC
jgi:hypothetical protein